MSDRKKDQLAGVSVLGLRGGRKRSNRIEGRGKEKLNAKVSWVRQMLQHFYSWKTFSTNTLKMIPSSAVQQCLQMWPRTMGWKIPLRRKIQPKMSVFLASSETLKFSVLIQTCSSSAAHPLWQISSSSAHMYIYYIISFYKGNTMQFHTIWQSVPGYNKWSLMKMLNSESFFIIQWNWICDFLGFYSHMALRWKFTRLSRFWIYS